MITKEELEKNPLFHKLDSLNLNEDEYVIFGSGAMFALGVRLLSDLNDLDLLVTTKGWGKVKGMAPIHFDKKWKCEYLHLFDKQIEIYNGWGPGEYIPEKLIKSSIKIGKYRFTSVKDMIRWKNELGRDKDHKHISMVMDFLKKKPHTKNKHKI